MSFSEDSACLGRTTNLQNVQPCQVSIDLSKILMQVQLSDYTRQVNFGGRRNLQTTGKIDPGDSFKFRITNIRNPLSFKPTDSMIY